MLVMRPPTLVGPMHFHTTFSRGQSSLRSISLAHERVHRRLPQGPGAARLKPGAPRFVLREPDARPTLLFQIYPAWPRLQFHHFLFGVGGMLGATRASRPAYNEHGSMMSIDLRMASLWRSPFCAAEKDRPDSGSRGWGSSGGAVSLIHALRACRLRVDQILHTIFAF